MSGKIIQLDEVDSTNIYTSKLLSHSGIDNWDMVIANSQTRGKGQRGKYWLSNEGENLLCSVFFRPKAMLVGDVFFASIISALATIKTLNLYGISGRIKWPNDVLVEGRKIAGTLIENNVTRGMVDTCIVGIGLNIQQKEFPEFPWPATSMTLEGATGDLSQVTLAKTLRTLLQELMSEFDDNADGLIQMYNSELHRRGESVSLKQGREVFQGNLVAVNRQGQLLIERNMQLMAFNRGEIQLSNLD